MTNSVDARLSWVLAAGVLLAAVSCGRHSPAAPSSGTPTGSGTAVIQGTVTGTPGSTSPSAVSHTQAIGMATQAAPAGLLVNVSGTTLSTSVDASGLFRIEGVAPGHVRLQFKSDLVDATADVGTVQPDQFVQLQIQVSGSTATVVDDERTEKVSLCHAEGNGTYHLIDVSQSAEAAHRAHGDAKVGEPVPGRPDEVFDSNCQPLGPSVRIQKSTNGTDAGDAPGPQIPVGDPVTWEYDVTNTGTVDLTSVAVTDDQGVSVNCNGHTTLAAGGVMTCTGSGVAVLGQYANIGTVTADWTMNGNSGTVTDSDSSHYLGVSPDQDSDGGQKVTLCHRTGAGFYVEITVGAAAEPAHLAHGDGKIGDPVPGQPGKVFGPGCKVQ
jgi:hypothetical protein